MVRCAIGWRGDGQCGEHDGQVGFDRIAHPVEHGSGVEVALGHSKRLLDVPEVVVFRNDLGGRHHGDRNVGYIAFEPDEGLRAGQAGFVEGAVHTAGFDESCPTRILAFFRRRITIARAGLPGPPGSSITAGRLAEYAQTARHARGLCAGIPDRLSAFVAVVDGAVGMPRGDGVDDLPIGEKITVPMEVRLQIPRTLDARWWWAVCGGIWCCSAGVSSVPG